MTETQSTAFQKPMYSFKPCLKPSCRTYAIVCGQNLMAAPPPLTLGREQQIQATAIAQALVFRAGLGALNLQCGQRHDINFSSRSSSYCHIFKN